MPAPLTEPNVPPPLSSSRDLFVLCSEDGFGAEMEGGEDDVFGGGAGRGRKKSKGGGALGRAMGAVGGSLSEAGGGKGRGKKKQRRR